MTSWLAPRVATTFCRAAAKPLARTLEDVRPAREEQRRDAVIEDDGLVAVHDDAPRAHPRRARRARRPHVDQDGRGRPAGQSIEEAPGDPPEGVIVLVLQVLAVGLHDGEIRLPARPAVDLGRHVAAARLEEDAPEELIGLELIADALEAPGVRPRRAAERGREHAQRLRRVEEDPAARRPHPRPERGRERLGLLVGVVGVDLEDVQPLRPRVLCARLAAEEQDQRPEGHDQGRDDARDPEHGPEGNLCSSA